MSTQLDLAIESILRGERDQEHRPKEKPADTSGIRAPSPKEPPKKRRAVKGQSHSAAFVQPSNAGGRVIMLDQILIGVAFEDPFYDRGQYPMALSLEDFAAGAWHSADPHYVAGEYERLGIMPPKSTADIECRCRATYLAAQYEALLLAARNQIDDELERIRMAGAACAAPA